MDFTGQLSDYLPRIRIFEWVCPYETWNNPSSTGLFEKIVQLKFDGYRPAYRQGILPVDSYDFVATHLLTCMQEGSCIVPLAGFKSISLARSQFHDLSFPAFSLFDPTLCASHEAVLREIIASHRDNPRNLHYDGSFTMNPQVRGNRPLHDFLMDIMRCKIVWHTRENAIEERVGCAVLKFRMPDYFQSIGYEPFSLGGQPLPTFPSPRLARASILMIRLRQCTNTALELAGRHRALWEQRLRIDTQSNLTK